jgi:hypothetical protein
MAALAPNRGVEEEAFATEVAVPRCGKPIDALPSMFTTADTLLIAATGEAACVAAALFGAEHSTASHIAADVHIRPIASGIALLTVTPSVEDVDAAELARNIFSQAKVSALIVLDLSTHLSGSTSSTRDRVVSKYVPSPSMSGLLGGADFPAVEPPEMLSGVAAEFLAAAFDASVHASAAVRIYCRAADATSAVVPAAMVAAFAKVGKTAPPFSMALSVPVVAESVAAGGAAASSGEKSGHGEAARAWTKRLRAAARALEASTEHIGVSSMFS